ncbi:MAG: hypothetical protein IJ961_07560 [Bacteroidales bacterium]|nr:hypothetical protein [Bacteroidales bacterium]
MTTVNGQQSTDFVQRIQKAIFKLEGRFFCVNKTTRQQVNKTTRQQVNKTTRQQVNESIS